MPNRFQISITEYNVKDQQDLWYKAMAGDDEAYNELAKIIKRYLRKALTKKCNHEVVDDGLQDVLS